MNCDDLNPISGATSINYTVTAIGNYACQITISNALGQVIYVQEVKSLRLKIDLNDVDKGVYILNLHNENQSLNKRILVK